MKQKHEKHEKQSLIPQRRSKSWLIWMLGYVVVITLLFWLARFVLGGNDFSLTYANRWLAFAAVLAIVINGFGWLGAKWIWLVSSLGVAVGLAMMLSYTVSDLSGWEDLASFLGFLQGVIIGFVLGVIVEVIAFILGRRERA